MSQALHNKMVLLATLIACVLIGGGNVNAQTERMLQPAAKHLAALGRDIYLGRNSRDANAALRGSDVRLSQRELACVNCHGRDGGGSREGGLAAPAIRWQDLSVKKQVGDQRTRAAYDEHAFMRALIQGVDASGNTLGAAMPAFSFTPEEVAGLLTYLKVIGTKSEPAEIGVEESVIHVGSVLPMTGRLALLGESLRDTLLACFAEVNAKGGIYGRRIELVVADADGSPHSGQRATAALLENGKIFSFIANLETIRSPQLDALLERHAAPLVGPLSLAGANFAGGAKKMIYDLLPAASDQLRALADYLHKQGVKKIGLVTASNALTQAALPQLQQQLDGHRMQTLAVTFSAEDMAAGKTVKQLQAAQVEAIIFIGNAEDLRQLATAMAQKNWSVPLGISAQSAGEGMFDLPPEVSEKIIIAYPATLPAHIDWGVMETALKTEGHDLPYPVLQSLAWSAAQVFIESAKRSGRDLTRERLRDALNSLHQFPTLGLPPLGFSRSNTTGLSGAFMVRIEASSRRYLPLTDWVSPRNIF